MVATVVEAAPGAFGSVPVVTVGRGAEESVFGAVVTGAVCFAPGPRVTVGFATIVVAELPDPFAATAAAVATSATARKRNAGHTQSPGYHGKRRCHAAARTPTRPRFAGSRAPHSRQYSWSGSYATPQRGQYSGVFSPLTRCPPDGRTGRRIARPRRSASRTRTGQQAGRGRARPRRR